MKLAVQILQGIRYIWLFWSRLDTLVVLCYKHPIGSTVIFRNFHLFMDSKQQSGSIIHELHSLEFRSPDELHRWSSGVPWWSSEEFQCPSLSQEFRNPDKLRSSSVEFRWTSDTLPIAMNYYLFWYIAMNSTPNSIKITISIGTK